MMKFLTHLARLIPARDESPEVTFNRIISERQKRYSELKGAVVKVLFLKNKLEGDLLERRAEIARIHHEARHAARSGRDRQAIALIERMTHLKSRLAHAEEQVEEIKREAHAVTQDMARIHESIRDLQQEKRESLAKLTAAELRKKLRKILDDDGIERENRHLDRVRAMVARASAESSLDDDLGGTNSFALADPSARIELARMKGRLLPA